MKHHRRVRLIRCIWSLYPGRWRKRYGVQLDRDLEDAFGEASEGIWPAVALVWDALVTLPRAWIAEISRAAPTGWIDGLAWDVRSAVRSVLRAPRLTLAVVLTLGIGIGANASIFSLVEGVLLRPPPFPDPDRVVTVMSVRDGERYGPQGLAFFNFDDWRDSQESFEALAVIGAGGATVTEGGNPQLLAGLRVSEDYFRVIGVEPFMGRSFSPEEYERDGPDVVVISYDVWSSRMASDPDVLGRTIDIDDQPYTVIGVMPEGFRWYRNADGTAPLSLWRPDPWDTFGRFDIVGRLRDGVSIAQADAELQAVGMTNLWDFTFDPADPNDRIDLAVFSLHETMTRGRHAALLLLLGAVGFILLIACLNVGNLLLARGEARLASITLRRALGASRARVLRELFAESLVLASLGALLGLVVARALIPVIVAVAPPEVVRATDFQLNATVLWFAVGLAIATALLTGAAPVLRATSPDLVQELKERGSGRTVGRSGTVGRFAVVVGEVAIATVLVVGGGLLLRSYATVNSVELGFDTDGIAIVQTTLSNRDSRYYQPEAIDEETPGYRVLPAAIDFVYGVRESMRRIPGIVAAAAGNLPPLPGDLTRRGVAPDGERPQRWYNGAGPTWGAVYRPVTADWFETLGIPLLEGRLYRAEEAARTGDVVVIDETLAGRLFPGESPVGHTLTMDDNDEGFRQFRIVGVVAAVRQSTVVDGVISPIEPAAVYFPPYAWAEVYPQSLILRRRQLSFLVRTGRHLADLEPALKQAVWVHDADLPVTVEPLGVVVGAPLNELRFNMGILIAFSTIALLLAGSGVFAVMAYAVARKTRELGIRIALGARSDQLLRRELGRGVGLALVGLLIGAVASVGLTRFLEALLFGVEPWDSRVYAATAVLLVSVAAGAAYVPARRAASSDATESLRME